MKNIHQRCLLMIAIITISGCGSGKEISPMPTNTAVPSLTSIVTISTLVFTPRPSPTTTLTPLATLEPKQANETIKTLLQEPVDCSAPCFWGIIPGRTTLDEAKNVFHRLGLQTKSIAYEGKEFYGTEYDFDSGVSILVNLTTQDKVVENLRVDINPETQKAGVPREWRAYSPETLMKRYGAPSRVEFFVGRVAVISYTMIVYFDKLDLIVEYGGYNVGVGTEKSFRVCPLVDQQDSIRIWLGANPENPPGTAISLEKATSMTLEDFSKLMTGNPNTACLDLKEQLFP